MPYCYPTDSAARQSGWNTLTAFKQTQHASPELCYSALAEYEMNGVYRMCLSVFLNVLSFVSCGYATSNSRVKQWQKEVEAGKVTAEIFCRSIGSSLPEIISDEWGKICLCIEGVNKTFRDVVINQSEAQEWNWSWSAHQMHHHPGVRKEDVNHFFFSSPHLPKPEAIILSRGRGDARAPGGVLEVMPGVEEEIRSRGVEVYVLKTEDAIAKYKQLQAQGKRIGALIHTTC